MTEDQYEAIMGPLCSIAFLICFIGLAILFGVAGCIAASKSDWKLAIPLLVISMLWIGAAFYWLGEVIRAYEKAKRLY